MNLVDIVAMLAIVQFLFFGGLVGKARGTYGVPAPSTSGPEGFERVNRVHLNTLELLIALLPSMYAATRYWSPNLVAGLGAVYLVGRIVYWRAYVTAPARRGLGFLLSVVPIFTLAVSTGVAALLGMLRG